MSVTASLGRLEPNPTSVAIDDWPAQAQTDSLALSERRMHTLEYLKHLGGVEEPGIPTPLSRKQNKVFSRFSGEFAIRSELSVVPTSIRPARSAIG